MNRSVATVRASAEHTARTVVDLAPRLFGASGLCRDERISQSTDADTTVSRTWVLDHLRYANHGADAVAGMADLDDPSALSPLRQRQYAELLAAGTQGDRHTHIYAANLGVRADAFLATDGFPATSHGEDHQLLARLIAVGHHVVSPTDVRVRTSSQRSRRASGGLADLLNDVPQQPGTPRHAANDHRSRRAGLYQRHIGESRPDARRCGQGPAG